MWGGHSYLETRRRLCWRAVTSSEPAAAAARNWMKCETEAVQRERLEVIFCEAGRCRAPACASPFKFLSRCQVQCTRQRYTQLWWSRIRTRCRYKDCAVTTSDIWCQSPDCTSLSICIGTPSLNERCTIVSLVQPGLVQIRGAEQRPLWGRERRCNSCRVPQHQPAGNTGWLGELTLTPEEGLHQHQLSGGAFARTTRLAPDPGPTMDFCSCNRSKCTESTISTLKKIFQMVKKSDWERETWWLGGTARKAQGELCPTMGQTTASWLRRGGGRSEIRCKKSSISKKLSILLYIVLLRWGNTGSQDSSGLGSGTWLSLLSGALLFYHICCHCAGCSHFCCLGHVWE